MFPCFTFFRILGIFPYKINVSIIEASRPRYILLIVVTCVNCFYVLIQIYIVNIARKDHRQRIPQKIQDNSYFILENIISIIWLIMTKPQMRLLQMVLDVSSKLSSKSYEKLSKLIHFKDIFGFFFLICQSLASLRRHLFMKEQNFLVPLILRILECYIRFQKFQINMLYINCVCIVKACFKRIDDNLINLRELLINDKSHPFGLIYCQERSTFLLNKLKILEKEYLMLSDTVQMLKLLFSPQFLAICAEVFIEITFELYINIVQWNNGISIDLTQQINNIFLTSYMLYHVIKLIVTVWACETGKNQAIKINTTIHDISNSTSNKQIRNELHLFSLQMLHCDNTFSGKGITVDAAFLRTMIRTITTYLLILIQFLIATHACDGRAASQHHKI
ncbi:hypothetical protein PUN28_007181 [Cardiocondyla obscurior]